MVLVNPQVENHWNRASDAWTLKYPFFIPKTLTMPQRQG